MDHNHNHNYSSFNPTAYNPSPQNQSSNNAQHQQYYQPPPTASRPHRDSALANGLPPSLTDSSFDILEWHPAYQSCQRYFLDHAQHDAGTQAVCALINIRLPWQWLQNPVMSSGGGGGATNERSSSHGNTFTFSSNTGGQTSRPAASPHRTSSNSRPPAPGPPVFISPIPYIRRLVVTGFDKPPILHGFFGDDYIKGIMPHVECERRNYLFAAKSGGWRSCKRQYDSGSGAGTGADETVPFMKALVDVPGEEVRAAERDWSRWLGMEDWMVGEDDGASSKDGIKQEGGSDREDGRVRGGHLERQRGGMAREAGRNDEMAAEGYGRGGGGMEGYRSH